MTEVLSIPREGSLSSMPVRRNKSQPSLFLNTQVYGRSNVPSVNYFPVQNHQTYRTERSSSISSSAPPSPRLPGQDLSSEPSYASTPVSSASLQDHYFSKHDEDEIQFPLYEDESQDQEGSITTPDANRSLESTPASSQSGDGDECGTLVGELSRLQSACDDTAVENQPSWHVDYLSHSWKEEDIWASWRHIVAKRRVLDNSERLENASWRTWAKTMNKLDTISPEALNWMKDHDVTWLYGPLQSGCTHCFGPNSPGSTPRLARSDSLVSKKSILKKRSLSEAMLQRSISNSNLIQRAVDSVVSQRPVRRTSRPHLGGRTISDFTGSRCKPSPASTNASSSAHDSSSESGSQTPNEKRRIHFCEKVEQCIAINKDGDELDDCIITQSYEDTSAVCTHDDYDEDDDCSSDDGVIMMKVERGKEQRLGGRNVTPRSSFSSDSGNKTIAMLPSTTLKYRGDTPDPPKDSKKEGAVWELGRRLVRSSSQETLKPSRPSSNFLLDDDDEVDMDWQPSFASSSSSSSYALSGGRDNIYSPRDRIFANTASDEDEEMKTRGLRRTASGMFMPYDEDEDEDDVVSAGLFGKVVDTVMTAKDIAHVIWNVGWRR